MKRLIVLLMCLALGGCYQNSSHQTETEVLHGSEHRGPLPSSINVSDLHQLLSTDSSGIHVIDVRTTQEVSSGTIGSQVIHADVLGDDFSYQVAALDRNDTYYVYCMKGGRSSTAQTLMKEMGFTRIVNVEGGLTAWQQAGYPLYKPNN